MQSVPYKIRSKTLQLKKVSNTLGHMGAVTHERNNCKCNGDQEDIFTLEYSVFSLSESEMKLPKDWKT